MDLHSVEVHLFQYVIIKRECEVVKEKNAREAAEEIMKLTVHNICCMAMLVALNIILTRVFSIRISFEGIEGIRIGFGTLPVILAGVLLGARQGFITGVIGDLIGFQLNPSGFYLPTFTLVAGLHGVLVPAMMSWFSDRILTLKKLVLVIGINNIITSLLLTPFLLQLHFGIPVIVTMPGRVIAQAILIPCMAIIINILVKRLQQSGLRTQGIPCPTTNSGQYTMKQG